MFPTFLSTSLYGTFPYKSYKLALIALFFMVFEEVEDKEEEIIEIAIIVEDEDE